MFFQIVLKNTHKNCNIIILVPNVTLKYNFYRQKKKISNPSKI